jgi:hypothetical protein
MINLDDAEFMRAGSPHPYYGTLYEAFDLNLISKDSSDEEVAFALRQLQPKKSHPGKQITSNPQNIRRTMSKNFWLEKAAQLQEQEELSRIFEKLRAQEEHDKLYPPSKEERDAVIKVALHIKSLMEKKLSR